MKVICTNDTNNTQGKIKVEDIKDTAGKVVRAQSHIKNKKGEELKGHIHKGAIFEIGTASTFAGLDIESKVFYAKLRAAGKIEDATPETIERVDKEIEAQKAMDAADAARASASDPFQVIADTQKKLAEILAALTAQKVPTK